MNPIPPIFCGTLLAAMMAAGVSHYWSIQGFVANHQAHQPAPLAPSAPLHDRMREKERAEELPQARTLAAAPAPAPATADAPPQKEFYEGLIAEMRQLRNENRDLLDQLSETNREVMKLEFRVDTHSESFRPLPTSEDRQDTTFGRQDQNFSDYSDMGVLPPRASPVYSLED